MNKVDTYEVDSPISKVEHQNQKCSKKLHFQKCRPPTFAPPLTIAFDPGPYGSASATHAFPSMRPNCLPAIRTLVTQL
jgi:hypothetical protein